MTLQNKMREQYLKKYAVLTAKSRNSVMVEMIKPQTLERDHSE